MCKMKNILEETNSRFDTLEVKICELENTELEIIQNESHRKKYWENKQSLVNCVTTSSSQKSGQIESQRNGETQKLCEEIKVENFQILWKLKSQKAQEIPNT